MTTPGATSISVDSDRPEMTEVLGRMARLVEDAGGDFLGGVQVRARDGELTIRRPERAHPRDRLMTIPYACLPDVNDFRVRLQDNKFTTEPKNTETLTDLKREIFECLIEVYNLMDKPQQWAEQTPALTLWHDPDLLEKLLDPQTAPGAQAKLDQVKAGQWNKTLIQTFLQSRVFNLKRGEKDHGEAGNARERVLMPFIDFMNHHLEARGFQMAQGETADQNALYVFQDRPVAGSDECYVVYSNLDRYTAYTHYGFLDESSPNVMSQGCEITLSHGLTLRIGRNLAGVYKQKLPAKIRDLRMFMPQVGSPDANTMNLSRLLIPGSPAPFALRRVLTVLLRSKRPNWDERAVNAAVSEAERKLLDQNHRFYDRLSEALAAARTRSDADDVPGRRQALHAIEQLIVRNKRHLYDYADRLDVGV